MESIKLCMQLEIGNFFNTYHDLMDDLVNQFDYLVDDDEEDYKTAKNNLKKCKAIIKAQKILLNVNLK